MEPYVTASDTILARLTRETYYDCVHTAARTMTLQVITLHGESLYNYMKAIFEVTQP